MSLTHPAPPITGSAATTAAMAITTVDDGGIAVLTVSGDLDQLSCDYFRQALAVALYDAVRVLIVDLTATTFLSTGAMTALLGADQRAASSGGRVVIAADGPTTARQLHRSGVSGTIAVRDCLDAALAAFRETPAMAAAGGREAAAL